MKSHIYLKNYFKAIIIFFANVVQKISKKYIDNLILKIQDEILNVINKRHFSASNSKYFILINISNFNENNN